MPSVLGGRRHRGPERGRRGPQQVLDGTSLLATLADPEAEEFHQTQYFEMLGSRSIFHDGWKATTNHISTGVLDEEERATGSRSFDEDRWELFNLDDDFSESTDRADQAPERLAHLVELWSSEAERNQVLPISDGMLDRFSGFIAPAYAPEPPRPSIPAVGRCMTSPFRCCGAASPSKPTWSWWAHQPKG